MVLRLSPTGRPVIISIYICRRLVNEIAHLRDANEKKKVNAFHSYLFQQEGSIATCLATVLSGFPGLSHLLPCM